MKSTIELLIYYTVRIFGIFIRRIPIHLALWIGRAIGTIVYYVDFKHKAIAHSNIKTAFARTKSSQEIKRCTKQLFKNYGQNLIELLRLPLMSPEKFDEYIEIEGRAHVTNSIKQGRGLILLAMHYGSWEMASLASSMMGRPYKVIVKPQKRYTRLNELLNSYRECRGSMVIERGLGLRGFVNSLKNNEIVGMVVDQGGRDGMLVPFFDRQASMSVGAIRMGLKLGVPVCFAIITRKNGPYHRFIIHKPFDFQNTGDTDNDLRGNLRMITEIMEKYISESPSEYMWFYKIWKYSKESVTVILDDGRTGHLRQSQSLAGILKKALAERNISSSVKTLHVQYKSQLAAKMMSFLSVFANNYIYHGRLGFMKWFLTKESFEAIMSIKADFIISCGSSAAAVNYLLSNDQQAKSMVILKPGLLSYNRFDLVVLPEHDRSKRIKSENVLYTQGALNLISKEYLDEQSDLLQRRFSHIKKKDTDCNIGLLLGGDTKDYVLSEQRVKLVVNQLKEVANELNASLLIATSRRTSSKVESMLQRELKKFKKCPLLILASRNNIPEAVGGILGMSDLVVVSGDSISMISEAACSGKKTIVFPIESRLNLSGKAHKHNRFINEMNKKGYILSAGKSGVKHAVYNVIKNKIQTRKVDDGEQILEHVRRVI